MVWRYSKTMLSGLAGMAVIVFVLAVGVARIHHGQFLSIQTGSMAPVLHPGDLVSIVPVPANTIHRGDVITFINPANPEQTITHRVVNTPAILQKPAFQTKGDANAMADAPIAPSAIVGKVSYSVPKAGAAADMIRTPLGLIAIIYIPALLIIIAEAKRLIRYYHSQQPYTATGFTRHQAITTKRVAVHRSLAIVPVIVVFISAGLAHAAFTGKLSLAGNVISASAQLPVCYVTGQITSDQIWTPECVYMIRDVAIPNGLALTVEAGTIIKVVNSGSGTAGENTGINVNAGGRLAINGAAGHPVIFTSGSDDSVGGDSDLFGPSQGAAGDYAGAIFDNGSNVLIQHTTFRYGKTALDVSETSSSITYTDNSADGTIHLASRTTANLTFMRNRSTTIIAANTDLSTLPLTGPDANTFTDGKIVASRAYLPSNGAWHVNKTGGLQILQAIDIEVNGTLDVDDGVLVDIPGDCSAVVGFIVRNNGVLNLHSDVAVKIGTYESTTNCAGNTAGVDVQTGGALNAVGAAGHPVIFTSGSDDSVGGNSNISNQPPANGDYGYAILVAGGSVTAQHCQFRYGNQTLQDGAEPLGTITFTDNVADSSVILSERTTANLLFQRNNFAATDSNAIIVSQTNLNTIPVTGPDKNTFYGSNSRGAVVAAIQSTVPAGATWVVDTANGLQSLIVNDVTVDGTLNLEHGLTVKIDAGRGGINVSTGSLNLHGTAADRVVFTSLHDDSVGGDTGGDGAGTPTASSYLTAINNSGGTIAGQYVIIGYAHAAITTGGGETTFATIDLWNGNTGVVASGGDVRLFDATINSFNYGITAASGDVMMRGSFGAIGSRAVVSCAWGTADCVVDASYSQWGTAAGPYPASGPLVCGQVLAQPWRTNALQTVRGDSVFGAGNCDSSETTAAQLAGRAATFKQKVDALNIQCGGGMSDACTAISSMTSCMDAGVVAFNANIGISFGGLPNFSLTGFSDILIGKMSDHIIEDATAAGTAPIVNAVLQSMQLNGQLNNLYDSCFTS